MIRRGVATFTLDEGKCPRWLFERMVRLGREMARVIVAEEGPDAFVRRMGDPVWFQSLGTVLAFDWNASGLTTILTAALKEAIRGEEKELGIFICGGKGRTSRKTPHEIARWGEALLFPPQLSNNLMYNSRMSAKVDSALIQDGFQIYHHSFLFSKGGAWTVVQQGMNTARGSARRYHWHSACIEDLIREPHAGIVSEGRVRRALDLTARKSGRTRDASVELAGGGFASIMRDVRLLSKHTTPYSQAAVVADGRGGQMSLLHLENTEFRTHPVVRENFSDSAYLRKILWELSQRKPENYEALLASPGVGPKTIRALALVAEVVYGARPSYEDPARYSFAHGGKDGTPYPVCSATYDATIRTMREYVRKSRIQGSDQKSIFSRLVSR